MDFKLFMESEPAPRTARWLYLKKYLKDEPFSVDGYHYLFNVWNKSEKIMNLLGIKKELDLDDGDEFYKDAEKIDNYFKNNKNEKQEFISFIAQTDPAYAPSFHYMDSLVELESNSWLVHLTDYPDQIKKNGFVYGVDEMDKLGLTTYFSDSYKKYGGYNFAFQTGSKDLSSAVRKGRYGKSAVMFMSAGLQVYHNGDDEYQVIFDGKNVKPKNIVVLEVSNSSGEWYIVNQNRNSNFDLFEGDFEDVVKWVENNYIQYRRFIF